MTSLFIAIIASLPCSAEPPQIPADKFGIHVIDEHGGGVPLVELRTVNEIRCVTDNAGWIVWDEPGLMDRDVFWHVSGPGIEREKDGFGFRGLRAVTRRGTFVECRVKTANIATRIGRLTGQGRYRDSELLGLPVPASNITEASVVGQDSVQAVSFNDQLFWLWGDTNQTRYPLGNFKTTCATTPRDIDPEKGFEFDYFRNPKQPELLRPMMPTTEPGVVWMFGLMSVKDGNGRDRLFAGFSRRPGLSPAHEQGIAEYDPEVGHFKKVAEVSKDNDWALPIGHAVLHQSDDGDYFYFCRPFAHVRVRANVAAISNPLAYELSQWDESSSSWIWRHGDKPTTQEDERQLLVSGKIKPDHIRYQLKDALTGQVVTLHTGSIAWNSYRNRFVMVALQITNEKSSPSHLGEMWYAESNAITGPWTTAVKIASHPKYSFYNPVHHQFFDREEGRIIYFEGTYTNQFSGNPIATARYDYNQVLYRLDLSDSRLAASHEDR
jgi:hypothetical protein